MWRRLAWVTRRAGDLLPALHRRPVLMLFMAALIVIALESIFGNDFVGRSFANEEGGEEHGLSTLSNSPRPANQQAEGGMNPQVVNGDYPAVIYTETADTAQIVCGQQQTSAGFVNDHTRSLYLHHKQPPLLFSFPGSGNTWYVDSMHVLLRRVVGGFDSSELGRLRTVAPRRTVLRQHDVH